MRRVKATSSGGGTSGSTDAADINIADAGNYYTATEVEAALQEVQVDLRANLAFAFFT